MEIVDKYLDEVCGYITNAPYKRAARRELQNHIEDCMACSINKGAECEEAAKYAIAEMGDAQEVGSQLNEHFSVHPEPGLIIFILGIFLLYTAVSVTINFSPVEVFSTVLAYGGCICLFLVLKRIDLEGNYRLIKYLYFGVLLSLLFIKIFADLQVKKECMSIAGVVLNFCIIFFVYRLHKSDTWGFIAALISFLLPIPLFLFASAYATLLLYLAAGLYIFVCFLFQGWKLSKWVKAVLPILFFGILGATAVGCSSVGFRKWKLWDYFILRSGENRSAYLIENFRTYPLAAGINNYGGWSLLLYLFFIAMILFELLQMKKRVHVFWGRSVLNCIVLMLSIKSIMAVLLNLGYPFVSSYMLPFAGIGWDQIANLLLIVLAEYVYCFGNVIFSDYSFFEENKLLERKEGRITFYYKNNS